MGSCSDTLVHLHRGAADIPSWDAGHPHRGTADIPIAGRRRAREKRACEVLVNEVNEGTEVPAREGPQVPLAAGGEAPATAQERSDEQERLPVDERVSADRRERGNRLERVWLTAAG